LLRPVRRQCAALAVRQLSFFQLGHAAMPAGVEREC